MKQQTMLTPSENYESLTEYLLSQQVHRVLIVCGNSLKHQPIYAVLEQMPEQTGIQPVYFTDFEPNPRLESVVKGIEVFQQEGCEGVLAIGGGSAMDVAKGIKLYGKESDLSDLLSLEKKDNGIPLVAIPTTAGTGSEATRFAVIYKDGEKESVDHDSILPDAVMLDESLLKSLPMYQRKATMLDALCHSIESAWAVNATKESQTYALSAIRTIMGGLEGYLMNTDEGNRQMLKAAYEAGQAINLSKTTAGHAMCYKLTTRYQLAHGHAAALCVNTLWPYMKKQLLEGTAECVDVRGSDYIKETLAQLEALMSPKQFNELLLRLEMTAPKVSLSEADYDILAGSVNAQRLGNHPIRLDAQTLRKLYQEII